jgi:hypothetical protein
MYFEIKFKICYKYVHNIIQTRTEKNDINKLVALRRGSPNIRTIAIVMTRHLT